MHNEQSPQSTVGENAAWGEPQRGRLAMSARAQGSGQAGTGYPGEATVIKFHPGPRPCGKDPRMSPSPNHSARSPVHCVRFNPTRANRADVLAKPQRAESKTNH